MKPKNKIIFTIGILFALVPMITFTPGSTASNSNEINLDNENLKISAVSGKINISGNSGWSAYKAAGNCTGNGTYSHPYVIKNLIIDAGGSGSGILIENSNVYFRIENITVYNSGLGEYHAGIELYEVTYGKLINNDASNNFRGIALWSNSNNNNISGNTVKNNNIYGINLGSSNNNTISGNNVSNNNIGLNLGSSNNNTISGNTANNNRYEGIHLWSSSKNIISGNTANGNAYGIRLYKSNDNTISGNTVNNNEYGISLSESSNSLISENTANDNTNGIDSYKSNNPIISGNIVNNNDLGIILSESNNAIISGNTANSNKYGISLGDSINNTLTGNLMNFCGIMYHGTLLLVDLASHSIDDTNLVNNKPVYYYVNENNLGANNFTNAGQILMVNCNDSIISNLNISNTSVGFALFFSNRNKISGNTANNNSEGIHLWGSGNNNISGNTADNNLIGIDLDRSDENVITGNAVNNNNLGLFLSYSNFNKILENTVNNNTCGIALEYDNDYNVISRNTANYNNYGIKLIRSNYNNITGNILLENNFCIDERDSQGNIFENNDCIYQGSVNYIPAISGYNLFFLLSPLFVFIILFSKKERKS